MIYFVGRYKLNLGAEVMTKAETRWNLFNLAKERGQTALVEIQKVMETTVMIVRCLGEVLWVKW